MSELRPKVTSAQRVTAFLTERGLAEGIVHFEQSTKTAQLAADAIGCELGQIAKSLVFVAGEDPVLALVAGDKRGDDTAIARELGAESVRFADPDTVKAVTGYTIGGVSPFDLPPGLTVLVDESLQRFETVYPAAGTSSSVVRMTLGQLVDITSGRVCAISR